MAVTFKLLGGLDIQNLVEDYYYLVNIKSVEAGETTELEGVLVYKGQSDNSYLMFTPFMIAPGEDNVLLDDDFYSPFTGDRDSLAVTVKCPMVIGKVLT